METEGCHCRADGATLELGAGRRSCSPAEQKDQQPSDIATEVAIHATRTAEQSVSSLICSGLQTLNGGRPADDAWEENYSVEQHGDVNSCGTYEEDVLSMQRDDVASRLEPYPPGPLSVAPTGPVMAPPSFVPTAQNTNNSNSCSIPSIVDEGLGGMVIGAGSSEPPKKRTKILKTNNAIEITLEGKNLWDEFCRRGTEMIVNRSGRRMFPGFSVAVSGLKSKVKYTMKLEVVLADNHRFKFLNARWLAVGTAEPQPLCESYIHPDSPNSGAFWMRHGISFRKLKITNNKERPGNNALLHSMHKYFLRLVIEEERKTPPGEDKLPAKTVLQMDFPETTFIAVTAYQNEEVTQLKITNNPFAKAFRDNAADMDWDTAQMLYSQHQNYSPLFQQYSEHFGNHIVAPGSWPLPSPLLPPTPLTASLPPISPLSSFNNRGYLTPTAHYPYTSSSCVPAPCQAPPHSAHGNSAPRYFQWPATGRHTHQTAQVIPSSSHDIYDQCPAGYICPSGLSQPSAPPTNIAANNLPDFDSVFSSALGPHTTHS